MWALGVKINTAKVQNRISEDYVHYWTAHDRTGPQDK
jgi:hypothetical protein